MKVQKKSMETELKNEKLREQSGKGRVKKNMSWKSYVIKGNSRKSCKGVVNTRRGWKRPGKSGNKMECAGYVLPDISGNVRKSAVLSMEYGLWRKWQEEKGKEGDGNEETRCRNRKTIDVMSV